jgi:hypothetical protein
MRPFRFATAASCVLVFTASLLTACEKQIEAPTAQGVCYQVIFLDKDGKTAKFNEVAHGRPSLESCAAALEGMRIRFLGLGSNQTDIVGAYQGNFLFLNQFGVFTSQTITGARYPALVRTGDGRLAVPGSVQTQ